MCLEKVDEVPLLNSLFDCLRAQSKKNYNGKKRDGEADEEKEISLSFHLLFHLCINLV